MNAAENVNSAGPMQMQVDIATQLAIEHLLARYVHALDDARLEEWPDFFTEAGRYRITTRENHDQGLPLCIIQADSRAMMRDRIAALRHANIYEAQTYRHIVSSILVKPLVDKASGAMAADPMQVNVVEAVSHFSVTRIMHDGAMLLFAVGRTVDRIVRDATEPNAWLLEDRLVILDSRRIDTLLAIPL